MIDEIGLAYNLLAMADNKIMKLIANITMVFLPPSFLIVSGGGSCRGASLSTVSPARVGGVGFFFFITDNLQGHL
jgi:hypothetical protein